MKIKVEDLVIGQFYYVRCGIWSGNVCFVGAFPYGKRTTKYCFTFGSLDNWKNQFGISAVKSKLSIEEVKKGAF